MLVDVVIFGFGFVLGGAFVFLGIGSAMKKELSKPPLSDEEKEERARQMLAKVNNEMNRSNSGSAQNGLGQVAAVEAIKDFAARSEAKAAEEANRLSMILREVREQIGQAPFCIVEGQALVHPELERELGMPGNEELRETLVMMAQIHPTAPE